MGVRIVPFLGSDFVTVVLSLGPALSGGAQFTLTDDAPGRISYSTPAVLVQGEQEKEVAITGNTVGTVTLSVQLTEYDGSPPSPPAPIYTIDIEVKALEVVTQVMSLEVEVEEKVTL